MPDVANLVLGVLVDRHKLLASKFEKYLRAVFVFMELTRFEDVLLKILWSKRTFYAVEDVVD